MRTSVDIEDIEAMRRSEGIDDAELRREIGELEAGDVVTITFMNGAKSCAQRSVAVRITGVDGTSFRGKLTEPPDASIPARLRAGSLLAFTASHIHSIPKGRTTHER
jgi:hypothetical protein